MTDVVNVGRVECPSAEYYPATWNVLGETLDGLLATLCRDVEQPDLDGVVEAVEKIVDALESLERRNSSKPATVAEAAQFKWHFLVDGVPIYLVPFATLDAATEQAVEFLELWGDLDPYSDARSVVCDFRVLPEGEIVHDFFFEVEGESDD